MATARKSTKPAVEETETVEAVVEPTNKQIIGEGIDKVIEVLSIDAQKNRYKAMRAIAHQAFVEAIESGDFEALVDRAIANADELPSGWEVERVAADASAKPVAKKAPAKAAAKPAAKAATKTTAKPTASTGRKRPTR